MIETASGHVPWHKDWHFKMEANPAYASLGPKAGWAYHRMRNLCGQTNNNGSMSFGAEKRMRMEHVKQWLPTIGITAREAPGVIRALRKSGLIQVSKAGVVTISRWREEQAEGKSDTMRKRKSRAGRILGAFLADCGRDRFEAREILGRMMADPDLIRLITLNEGKPSLLSYAQRFLERLNAGPGGGALVSDLGTDSGCDMSHRGSVTCHTPETKDKDEDKEDTLVSPKQPNSRNQRGSGGGQGSVCEGFASSAPPPGPAFHSPPAGFPAEGDSVEAMIFKYDPVTAACKLTGWHGDQAENTFRKKLYDELEASRPGMGESIWWDCLRETEKAMAAGRVRGVPRQYLLGVANRAIKRGGVA